VPTFYKLKIETNVEPYQNPARMKKQNNRPHEHFFLPHWIMFQDGYKKIERWKGYRDVNPNIPFQTNLDHQNGVDFLTQFVLPSIGSTSLRRRMTNTGVKNHEVGEIDNGDTLWHNKTKDKHTKELTSFDKMFTSMEFLSTRSLEILREAFLIQFISDEKVTFKGHPWAEKMLFELRKNHEEDGRVLNAIELLDYVLFAMRAFNGCKDVVILKHVYCNQVKKLDEYSRTIVGFDKWWTTDHSKTAHKFMRKYKDIPGPKGPNGENNIPNAYAYAIQKGYMSI